MCVPMSCDWSKEATVATATSSSKTIVLLRIPHDLFRMSLFSDANGEKEIPPPGRYLAGSAVYLFIGKMFLVQRAMHSLGWPAGWGSVGPGGQVGHGCRSFILPLIGQDAARSVRVSNYRPGH